VTSSQNVKNTMVMAQTVPTSSQISERIALFDSSGVPIDITAQTGANVKLTGFVTGATGALAAADTLNAALAKLQARIVVLEAG
jgi:hypothetical protein